MESKSPEDFTLENSRMEAHFNGDSGMLQVMV